MTTKIDERLRRLERFALLIDAERGAGGSPDYQALQQMRQQRAIDVAAIHREHAQPPLETRA